MYIRKKEGKVVQAWELGAGSDMQYELEQAGLIVDLGNGEYELFSQESNSGSGEIAQEGDFFKVDSTGSPYPNDREWFWNNHRSLGGYDYEQIPAELFAWDEEDGPMPDPVLDLIDAGKLEVDENSWDARYGAELWGSWLTAAADAVIVFYDVDSLDFNFVARNDFELAYDIVG